VLVEGRLGFYPKLGFNPAPRAYLLGDETLAARAADSVPGALDVNKLQVSRIEHHLQLTAGIRHLPEVGPVAGGKGLPVAQGDLAGSCSSQQRIKTTDG